MPSNGRPAGRATPAGRPPVALDPPVAESSHLAPKMEQLDGAITHQNKSSLNPRSLRRARRPPGDRPRAWASRLATAPAFGPGPNGSGPARCSWRRMHPLGPSHPKPATKRATRVTLGGGGRRAVGPPVPLPSHSESLRAPPVPGALLSVTTGTPRRRLLDAGSCARHAPCAALPRRARASKVLAALLTGSLGRPNSGRRFPPSRAASRRPAGGADGGRGDVGAAPAGPRRRAGPVRPRQSAPTRTRTDRTLLG